MNKPKYWKVVTALFALLGLAGSAIADETATPQLINVGVYDFPPYVITEPQLSGVSRDMIEIMNQFQHNYVFRPVITTATRRYIDFDKRAFEMLIFENRGWGWLDKPVSVSQAFLTGSEHYLALAKPGRDQTFFSDFNQKAMVGILGYHYSFARFNADTAYLNKNFNILLTDSPAKSLELIFKQRGEIAVLSKAYLNYHFTQQPQDQAKLLISDTPDQIYRHTILLRKDQPKITIAAINQLLLAMKQQGVLIPLWHKYGLGPKTSN